MSTKKNNKYIYLAEFIGEGNYWEWYDVFDCKKWTLLQVFQSFADNMFADEWEKVRKKDIKREDSEYGDECWMHKEENFRVWKLII